MDEPERMSEILPINIKQQAEPAITELLRAKLSDLFGNARYECESSKSEGADSPD